MRISIVAGVVPFRTHGKPGVTAAHLVTSALLHAFRAKGHDVSVLCMLHQSHPSALTDAEAAELSALREAGIHVHDTVFLNDFHRYKRVPFRAVGLLLNTAAAIRHFYPGAHAEAIVHERLRSFSPDVVVPIWSQQGVAATYRFPDAPVVPYQGDIDFEPPFCRLVHDRRLFIPRATLLGVLDGRLRLAAQKRAHLAVMRGVAGIAHNAASNAEYYAAHGYKHSEYVGSLWPLPTALSSEKKELQSPRRIIGHVGYLNRTGSTYGLRFLLRDVLPRLETIMTQPYEVHIIGGGEPVAALQPLLSHPRVVRHGFVKDLDAFLTSADVLCLFNNAAPYLAAYTRHILAFASRHCLIAHERSKRAIPELIHSQNCLLCRDGKHAAEMVAAACTDQRLNASLREGGGKTYDASFTPSATAERMEQLFHRIFMERKAASSTPAR